MKIDNLKEDLDGAERVRLDRKMITILSVFSLLGLLLVTMIMIGVNSFNGLRGYTNLQGYSIFAHQDARFNLEQYLNTGNSEYYNEFENALEMTRVKTELREELTKNRHDKKKIHDLFLRVNTHPQDISQMLSTYKRFHKIGHFAEAIRLWVKLDEESEKLGELGAYIRQRVEAGDLNRQEVSNLSSQIQVIVDAQHDHHNQLAISLSDGSMLLNRIAIWVSVLLGLILMITGAWLAFRFMNSIKTWQRVISVNEQRYKSLFEHHPDAVFSFDLNGNFVSANKNLATLTESTIEELLKISFMPFLPAKEQDRVLDHFDKATRGEPQTYDYEAVTAKGNKIFVNITNLPIVVDNEIIGVYGIAKNITHQVKAEKEIRRAKERYDLLARSTGDKIYDWDLANNNMIWNGFDETDQHFGYKTMGSSIEGWLENIHPDDVKDTHHNLMEALEDPSVSEWTKEYRLKKVDGRYGMVMERAFITRNNTGKAIRMLGALQDISERKKQEYEREQLIDTLVQRNNDLQQFSYITSHNLRSPLSNLKGLLNLIDYLSIEDDELREIIDGFKTSTELLNTTVDDLSTILTIKGNASVEQKRIRFEDIFNGVLQQSQILTKKYNPTIHSDFDQAPELVFNRTYLESIFLNLFTNALKYRSPDRAPEIKVSTKNMNDHIALHFQDNGLGMDVQRHKDKIFGLYQRFHDNSDGKGLGLYLIKTQIETLGGAIDIKSTVGSGTEFILKFKKIHPDQVITNGSLS